MKPIPIDLTKGVYRIQSTCYPPGRRKCTFKIGIDTSLFKDAIDRSRARFAKVAKASIAAQVQKAIDKSRRNN